ncbi:BrnT family toxin [Glaciimonas sp. GS1]|uniref:BrnT family toxin n=2 Tax=Glaciimonas soli TaxID=2590999 RepID=A0A843YRK5_9BURK|nr:BrnT family toxin [Glaciimonas soli]
MCIEFDQSKRDKTYIERGLEFASAAEIFTLKHLTVEDTRNAYSEPRFQTMGWLEGRIVMVVWTSRGKYKRIISMRKANEREIAKVKRYLD